jgi:hypothetical protein
MGTGGDIGRQHRLRLNLPNGQATPLFQIRPLAVSGYRLKRM